MFVPTLFCELSKLVGWTTIDLSHLRHHEFRHFPLNFTPSHMTFLYKMANTDEFCLVADFIYVNKANKTCTLKLAERALFVFMNDVNVSTILLDDITGCKIDKKPTFSLAPKESRKQSVISAELLSLGIKNQFYLHIYSYPLVKKPLSELRRYRQVSIFCAIPDSDDNDEDAGCMLLDDWRTSILGRVNSACHGSDAVPSSVYPKKLLILVNPVSGQGKAQRLFDNYVVHMINEAEIPHDVVLTEHPNHAYEIARDMDLQRWLGVVVVSGDGLLHEVINGLMNRDDNHIAIKLPVGIIAAGSGNGLSVSLNYYAGEPFMKELSLHSTFTFLKHRPTPMDLVLVQTPSVTKYSFLSITTGIFADVDYESERRRNWGQMRFTVGAIVRIVDLRIYRYRLSYLPVVEYKENLVKAPQKKGPRKIRSLSFIAQSGQVLIENDGRNSESEKENSTEKSGDSSDKTVSKNLDNSIDSELWKSVESDRSDEKFSSCELSDGDVVTRRDKGDYIPSYEITDGMGDNDEGTSKVGSENVVNGETENADERTEIDLQTDELKSDESGIEADEKNTSDPQIDSKTIADKLKANEKRYSTDSEISREDIVADFSVKSQQSSLLKPLDQPVPDTWKVIEGDFVGLAFAYQSHLGPEYLMGPQCRLNNGFMQAVIVKQGISRRRLIKLMELLKTGDHIDEPDVLAIKMLAFRLEPIDVRDGTIFMVDGEMIKACPMQAQVLPGVANIMALDPQ